jgi:hypothetical protein
VWVLTLPLALAWDATGHRWLPALTWGLLIAVTGSLIPMAVIGRGARRGEGDGLHVTTGAGRRVPLPVAGLGLGFVVLAAGDAPAPLVASAAVVVLTHAFGYRVLLAALTA